jgi:hypothetical protein
MDFEDTLTAPARELLALTGVKVTVKYWEREKDALTRDSQGDYEWGAADTETTTPAEIVVRGTPSFDRRADGVSDDIQAFVWLSSDVPVSDGEHTTDDSGTEILIRASQIIDPRTDDRYRVDELFDERNGKYRCLCSNE